MRSFVREFGRTTALHLESCVHCGLCAEACHFHVTTGDAKYTPIRKLELLRRAYWREAGPFAPLVRALGLVKKPGITDLQAWQELLYDSCTMCGRCTTVCPMGIDIAELVRATRHGMFEAGLVPERLALMDRTARQWGSTATPGEDGRRPVFGDDDRFATDPLWREDLLFFEYFDGDTGRGLGASHQTGWTGLVADLIIGRRG